ncbi:hypothetical protein [Flavobacterium sp.]|uniref:hypothetical protein n=1 Tax=Flavobacterium sp. TaxID=239 RepID=UPI0025E7018C|nr:hypothetical protein [Flavobacterium sp.]
MKPLLYLSFLLFSAVGFSQQPVSLVLGKTNSPFPSSSPTFNGKNISLRWNLASSNNFSDRYLVVVYNPITRMNDHYVNVSDKYYLTNTKSFPIYNFDGTRIDAFNPNGASDLGSGIVNGLVNMLLKKF